MDLQFFSHVFIYCLGALSASYLTYNYLKYKIHITVECWFCMAKLKVKYSDGNSWHCQYCDQYNGFHKDGSYNKILHEHYQNNKKSYCEKPKLIQYEHNRLCDECNQKQQVRIKLLADFVPVNEHKFDQEIFVFRRNLDQMYKLCENCEILVGKIIFDSNSNNNENGGRNIRNHCVLANNNDGSRHIINSLPELVHTTKQPNIIIIILILLATITSLSFLLYFSSQAAQKNDNEMKKGLLWSDQLIHLYENHYHSVTVILFIGFLLQIKLEAHHNAFVDTCQICLWIALLTNGFHYHLFNMEKQQIFRFHQIIFSLLISIYILKTFFHFYCNFSKFEGFGNKKKFQNRKKNIVDEDVDHHYIRKHIKHLSLSNMPTKNISDMGNVFQKNFLHSKYLRKGNVIEEMPFNYGHFEQTLSMVNGQNYSYFYTIKSNMNPASHLFKSNPKPNTTNSNTNNAQRILNYYIAYTSTTSNSNLFGNTTQTKLPNENSSSEWPTIFNIFSTLAFIMTLTILLLMVVILSMPNSSQCYYSSLDSFYIWNNLVNNNGLWNT